MKPIRVFTHVACEPPGYMQNLLEQLGYPYEQVCLFDGKSVPMELDEVSALVFMGGPGDVNEPTAWMVEEFELIRKAHAQAMPILGICLGAQLMSKALGGKVWQDRHMEVGFHSLRLLDAASAVPWFEGLPQSFTVFQWHSHSFTPPPGVETLAASDCAPCQAYALGDSLALQFHLEMTESIISSLLDKYAEDLAGVSACVQGDQEIRDNIADKCAQTFAVADILLRRWLQSAVAKSLQ